MSKSLLYETKSVLAELKRLRKNTEEHSRKLLRYETLVMDSSRSKCCSKRKYYIVSKDLSNGSRSRKYLGTDRCPEVKAIKAARYYKKLLQVLDRDIQLLETIDKDFIIPDHEGINGLLPKVYRSEMPPFVIHASKEAAEWKKQKEAEKAQYEPYRPEDLKYTALDGTKMRSLSETLIANYLLSLGITFVYELPLEHHGKRIRPDFTILSPVDNKTVIIIEHQGAMGNEDYHGKYIRTLLFYLNTEFVPNKDVFFTFNHLNGSLDLRQIDCILHIAFGYKGSTPASLN